MPEPLPCGAPVSAPTNIDFERHPIDRAVGQHTGTPLVVTRPGMAHGAWRMFDASTSPSATSDPVVRSRGPAHGRCNPLISHYRCACDPAADPAASGSDHQGAALEPALGMHGSGCLPLRRATAAAPPRGRQALRPQSHLQPVRLHVNSLDQHPHDPRLLGREQLGPHAAEIGEPDDRALAGPPRRHRGGYGPRGGGWVLGHSVQTLHRGDEHWARSLLKRTPPGPTPGVHTLPGDPVARCMKELQVGAVASVLLPWRRTASAKQH